MLTAGHSGAAAVNAGARAKAEREVASTRGLSNAAIYRLVARVLAEKNRSTGRLLDVGCGQGQLWNFLPAGAFTYTGADLERYEGFPAGVEFIQADLESGPLPCPDARYEVVVAAETIEHLENPRAFMRELARLATPGGLIVVTTPNQLSWLSKWSLLFKNQFNAFQEAPGLYPSHKSALLEIDLLRMARECGLASAEIRYTGRGRMPCSPWHWPAWLGFRGRRFSDNVLLVALKPERRHAG